MNVFSFRNQIIKDYSDYVSSFISIAQPRLDEFVKRCFSSGSLWPDPVIQLNPTFKPGKTVDELVGAGVLNAGCSQVFRRDKTAAVGRGEDHRFHQHQEDAIRKAKQGRNYVQTTGTGSGKSLSYIVPIVDHVLRAGSGRGIQAIIIYPMNALANSQFGELEKSLKLGFSDGKGPVTFERYTGQEDEETRTRSGHTTAGARLFVPAHAAACAFTRCSTFSRQRCALTPQPSSSLVVNSTPNFAACSPSTPIARSAGHRLDSDNARHSSRNG